MGEGAHPLGNLWQSKALLRQGGLFWLITIRALYLNIVTKKSAYKPSYFSGWHLFPVFIAWRKWEYFCSPLDGMLVHGRIIQSSKYAATHLYA